MEVSTGRTYPIASERGSTSIILELTDAIVYAISKGQWNLGVICESDAGSLTPHEAANRIYPTRQDFLDNMNSRFNRCVTEIETRTLATTV